jgi:hypothetical protein
MAKRNLHRSAGLRSICGNCDLEIERHPPIWLDRGNCSRCPTEGGNFGPLHIPAGMNVWTLLGETAKRHMRAICSDNVTKSNIIGLRKAFNHVALLRKGYSGNRSSVTREEVEQLDSALGRHLPTVRGELHDSGLKLLRSKRYAKRLAPVADIIADIQSFRLVAFENYESNHHAPIYQATDSLGRQFRFRNLPWQAVAYSREGLESGPVVLSVDRKGL